MNLDTFKTYNDLITFARSEFRQKGGSVYYELHHILPRSMGGQNTPDNLILLTIGEHVLAHYLLALECEAKGDHKNYVGNIQAAWLVCHGKSKFSGWKKLKLEEWLKDPEAQKLSEDIKLKFLENKKIEKGNNAGKSIAAGTLQEKTPRIWVQKATQKPVRILERNLGKGSWIGYTKIEDCPICHQPNSNDSFACCDEHKAQYIVQQKEQFKKMRSEQSKEHWKDDNFRNAVVTANTGIKHGSNGIWVTNGSETKMIKETQLGEYINNGWIKGRSGIEGHAMSEESKQKVSERRSNSVYVHKDGILKEIKKEDLEGYLSDGWERGTIGTPRKGIKQPEMVFVHNNKGFKKIRKADLEEYLSKGYLPKRK